MSKAARSHEKAPRAHSFLFTRDRSLGQEAAEDYTGRKVPFHWKRPVRSLAITCFGSATSVFAFALGGQIALTSGMATLLCALAISLVIVFPATALVMWHTSGRSMDTDLLSRGIGYGYRGSAFTALVYGLNWLMYAGFETAFLAAAIHAQWSAPPMWVLYLVTAMVIVPLNWFGISQLHWLQKWTVPLFVLGLGYIIYVALQRPEVTVAGATVSLASVLPALGAVLANGGIWILLIADYSRFVRTSDRRRAIIAASGAGLSMEFMILPLLGGWLALHTGSSNPGSYAVELTGVAGLIWVLITQLRVQEGNYYLGSLSLSTFFSRTLGFGRRPLGRPLFLTAVGVVAFLLALFGIANNLTGVLTFMGVFLLAWVSTVITALLVERRGLADGTTWIEHRRPHLRSWGAPALTGLATASVVGGVLAVTNWPSPYGSFLGIAVGIILAPAIMLLGTRRPVSAIHSEVKPPEDWRDAGPLTDADVSDPTQEVTCNRSGITVLRADACEWPVGSGRIVSARVAETE